MDAGLPEGIWLGELLMAALAVGEDFAGVLSATEGLLEASFCVADVHER